MTTAKQRTNVLSFHRILIMLFALGGIWINVDLPEDIFFTIGTAIWVWSPYLVHLELKWLARWKK